MNNTSVKQIVIIGFLIAIGCSIYMVALPFYRSLVGDNLRKQAIIKSSSEDKRPIYLKAKKLTVEANLAVTPDQRERGLGDVLSMSEKEGMLFVFEKPGFYQIWMKDMLFSIDVLWLNQDLKVIDIKKNVQPSSYPEIFTSRDKASYILEVSSGIVDKYGINIGTEWVIESKNINI